MSKLVEVNSSNFDATVMKSATTVLVDFWAPWCGPCRMLSPVIEKVAEDFEGKAKVFKLNVDENPENARKYGIRGIPALKIFKKGKVVDDIVGFVPQEVIKTKLNSFL